MGFQPTLPMEVRWQLLLNGNVKEVCPDAGYAGLEGVYMYVTWPDHTWCRNSELKYVFLNFSLNDMKQVTMNEKNS